MLKSMAVAMCWLIGATVCQAQADPAPSATAPAPPTVELFTAIDNQQVSVRVIPRSYSQLTILATNKTKTPLVLELPEMFAAIPTIASLADQGSQRSQRDTQSSNTPQTQGLGSVFRERWSGTSQRRAVSETRAVWKLDPGQSDRKKLPCFCLEFGKPDPHPDVPYRVARLEELNSKPEIRALLERFGRGECEQLPAQLAAWNMANGVGWQNLARLRLRGVSARTVAQAQQLVGELQTSGR